MDGVGRDVEWVVLVNVLITLLPGTTPTIAGGSQLSFVGRARAVSRLLGP